MLTTEEAILPALLRCNCLRPGNQPFLTALPGLAQMAANSEAWVALLVRPK